VYRGQNTGFFNYDDYEIDVVPYGYVAKEDDNIYWPPEETIAMSVKGFDEVLSDAITVDIDDKFSIKIASLHGLFLLKFNAWMDRHLVTNKDAEDMSFILSNYLMANLDREAYMEVYDWENFDEYVAGAYWLAHDLADLLTADQLEYYADKIEDELQKEERSYLLNQMLDSQSGLTYDQLHLAWEKIIEVFRSTKK
jgi:predicted nucleotidyltransferase